MDTDKALDKYEDELSKAEKRNEALKAERDALTQRVAELEAESSEYHQLKESLRTWKPQLNVHPVAGVQMEVEECLFVYETTDQFNQMQGAHSNCGWHWVGWNILYDNTVAVMWQRPVRQEAEEDNRPWFADEVSQRPARQEDSE